MSQESFNKSKYLSEYIDAYDFSTNKKIWLTEDNYSEKLIEEYNEYSFRIMITCLQKDITSSDSTPSIRDKMRIFKEELMKLFYKAHEIYPKKYSLNSFKSYEYSADRSTHNY